MSRISSSTDIVKDFQKIQLAECFLLIHTAYRAHMTYRDIIKTIKDYDETATDAERAQQDQFFDRVLERDMCAIDHDIDLILKQVESLSKEESDLLLDKKTSLKTAIRRFEEWQDENE